MREKGLSITFINVGYGEAVLVECFDGRECFTMLIDGGSGEASEYEASLPGGPKVREGSTERTAGVRNPGGTGRIRAVDFLEKQGLDHLDLMVNTHIHEDHTCGLLPVVERWVPGELWQPYQEGIAAGISCIVESEEEKAVEKFLDALDAYRELCRRTVRCGGKVRQMAGRKRLPSVCAGLYVEVLGPSEETLQSISAHFAALSEACAVGKPCSRQREEILRLNEQVNNSSMILMLHYAGRKILLPGDTECTGYGNPGPELKADIFKVGHHGQKNGVDEALLEAVAPEYAVISASSDRRYDSAHPEALRQLGDFGARLFFTDCPEVPPYTDGLKPHAGVRFTVSPLGEIRATYMETFPQGKVLFGA